jgi:hypothetical protein
VGSTEITNPAASRRCRSERVVVTLTPSFGRGVLAPVDADVAWVPDARMESVTAVFDELPLTAAWRHEASREGFEVVFFRTVPNGVRLEGCTAAVEDGQAWVVGYEIVVDKTWRTRSALVWARSRSGEHEVRVQADGSGRWLVDGAAAEHLDGCIDIDLESSACTSTLPVHRLALGVGEAGELPAVYVRALDLDIERLEQRYLRVAADDDTTRRRFHYSAPRFDYDDHVDYDSRGLVLHYPGIATRIL